MSPVEVQNALLFGAMVLVACGAVVVLAVRLFTGK